MSYKFKACLKKWTLRSAKSAMILGLTQAAVAANGVDAIQLDYIALDTSVNCNRIFFKSSQHFNGTIFVVPRVVPDAGPEGGKPLNITRKKGSKQYSLAMKLFFPKDDEVLVSSHASQRSIDPYSCNWDEVKFSLNENIADPSKKITTISRLPLTAVEVRVGGTSAVGRIGRSFSKASDVDVLDYYGRALTVEIPLTEDEKNSFISELTKENGVPARVRFSFQASSRDGSVHVEIDSKKLAANLKAELSGEAKVAKGRLQSAIAASMSDKKYKYNQSVTITNEGGRTVEGQAYQKMILEKILKEVDFSLKQESAAVSTQVAKNDKEETGKPSDASAPADGGLFDVNVVIDILSSQDNRKLQFDQLSAPEEATAETEIRLRSFEVADPQVQEVMVRATDKEPSVGIYLQAGDSMSISAAYTTLDRIDYVPQNSFLNVRDIKTLDLHEHFPGLLDPRFYVSNQKRSQQVMAIGENKIWKYINNRQYYWKRTQFYPEHVTISQEPIASTLTALNSLKVGVAFSALGKGAYSFEQLMQENDSWTAKFDEATGRLIITALQDLGSVSLRQSMTPGKDFAFASKVLDQVVQIKQSPFGTDVTKPAVLMRDKKALTLQRTIVFNVSRYVDTQTYQEKSAQPRRTAPLSAASSSASQNEASESDESDSNDESYSFEHDLLHR